MGEGAMRGFKEFLLRGNVLELAVAVVIGVAFTAMINALVKDLITPLIAALGGKPDFSALTFTINGSRFLYGDFINYLIAFIIIAAVVYFLVVLPLNWAISLRKKEAEATLRKCPECLSEIPKEARRCAFCTAPVSPAG
jgi:large conductance mechanosensitive channel